MDKLRKYLVLFLYLISAITYVKCDGQIAVMRKPSSMKYNSDNQMVLSDLMESIEHLMGYQYEGAKQMEMMNPFDLEDTKIILVSVNNEYTMDSKDAIKTFKMKQDMAVEDMIKELEKTAARENSFGKKVSLESVSPKGAIDVKNGSPQLFLVDLTSMSNDEVRDAINSLEKSTQGLSNVLEIILSSDGKTSISYDREKRQSPPATDEANETQKPIINANTLNLADDYDENFPVIFNIMLWFSLALIFALIAICMVIANMDPGRDSIIYRMTSTRMKKDN
ncbi:renin receptor [Planococcus citri]|uniref:renin receptor n=1 Tax=Planococcus citri TaxID=170843 RepID=UPI0031F986DC